MESQPFDRLHSVEALGSERFDVLVVGGGVTGCGVALDAAARGLHTALVEAADFASGTSSRSSKLVHGGLRYLQQHDYHLVYQALHERQRLIRNAPHLVHPLPFLVPLFGREGVVSEGVAKAYSVALWLYDLTGGIRIGRRHRRISAGEALDHFPDLRTDRLVASFLYWDAQADDARLTLALARTAARRGAVVANYCPVVELLERDGRVAGARLADGTDVRAAAVVNASGVWSEAVAHLAGAGAMSPVAIRPAKGVHIAVPAAKLPCDFAAVLPVPNDKRSIFVVPWAAAEAQGPTGPGRYTYVGTTDTDYDGPLDDPACTAEDVEYLLWAVNAWTTAGLTPADVSGTWAGLRPLISGERRTRTADLSRRHAVITSPNGLVSVTGGKLTTYRRMAADTVDAVARLLRPDRRVPPCATARLPLLGAGASARRHRTHDEGSDDNARGGDPDGGLGGAELAHLLGRHGSEAAEVVALCRADPSLARALVPGLPYLRAEAVYAVRSEMAVTLDDVLSRRTRAAILDGGAAAAAAADVAALIAPELGWGAEAAARQAASFVSQFGERSPSHPVRR
ncbi:MAG: glycerol-3-phosphate dehydrogenase/oxidase [Acidimicrobiales bacterium]